MTPLSEKKYTLAVRQLRSAAPEALATLREGLDRQCDKLMEMLLQVKDGNDFRFFQGMANAFLMVKGLLAEALPTTEGAE